MNEPAKLPVSVCILTKNEADNMRRCLPALKDFAEVVIADSQSTDETVKLCEEAGAKVYQIKWKGFGASRRELFELATQPWIFWLDADEVPTPKLLDELKDLFKEEPATPAYRVNRMVSFEGKWVKHGDWFPDWVTRLFRRDVWNMDDRAVHESIQINGDIKPLAGLLEHYSFKSWDDYYKRSDRYARLWVEEHMHKGSGVMTPSLRSAWRFIRGYVLKKGFMDGSLGFQIARGNAREVYMKYKLLREAKQKAKK